MRVARAKEYRRIMLFFRMSFGIEETYKVLCDGNFIHAALEAKVSLRDQLPKVMTGQALPVVTKCVVTELRKLGEDFSGAAVACKSMQQIACPHKSDPISADECIRSMIGTENPECLCVGTQDRDLQDYLANTVGGVPYLFVKLNVPILAPPSQFSKDLAKKREAAKIGLGSMEAKELSEMKKKRREEINAKKKKRKIKGGPNPLSVKKKKKNKPDASPPAPQKTPEKATSDAPSGGEGTSSGKKRSRSRSASARKRAKQTET